MDFYKLDPTKDIIVIADDISLPTGKIRIRAKGSAGGHNGLKSIIAHAGTDQFTRIKVGVGANQGDLVKHVLGKFSSYILASTSPRRIAMMRQHGIEPLVCPATG